MLNQKLEDKNYGTYEEISSDRDNLVGTPENYATVSKFSEQNPLIAVSAENSLKQIKNINDFNAKQTPESGAMPGDPANPAVRREPQPAATWFSTVGLQQGTHGTGHSATTGLIAQKSKARYLANKLGPFYDKIVNGFTDPIGNRYEPVGPSFYSMSPEEQASELERPEIAAFNPNSTEKKDFLRYTTNIDERFGTSAYHMLISRGIQTDTILREGEDIYNQIKTSDGKDGSTFRFARSKEGIRQFNTYGKYYTHNLNDIREKTPFGHMPAMLLEAAKDMLVGAGQTFVPEDQIDAEWVKDPEKYKRVQSVFAKLKDLNLGGRQAMIDGGLESELEAVKIASKISGRDTSHLTKDDMVITDPDAAEYAVLDKNMPLVKEIIQLNKEGAFTKTGRLGPLCSVLDGLVLNATGLVGMFMYSTDPTSAVNRVKHWGDLVFPEGKNDEEKQLYFDYARIDAVNAAIAWQEENLNWTTKGLLMRTDGGMPGQNYLSDSLNSALGLNQVFQGNRSMLTGGHKLLDPFVVGSATVKLGKAWKMGFTRKAVMQTLIDTTAKLNGFQAVGAGIPDTIKPIVGNIKQTLLNTPKFAGKELTDMDVLNIVARGDGVVTDLAADGSKIIRELSGTELKEITKGIGEQTLRVQRHIVKKQKILAEIAAENKNTPNSAFGKWVVDKFNTEFEGFDLPTLDQLRKQFAKAEGASSTGESILAATTAVAPSASTAYGVAKMTAIAGKVGLAAGISGIMTGNMASGPAYYISGLMLLPDLMSMVGFAARGGRLASEFAEYATKGRTMGGSVAALRIAEREKDIIRYQLELEKNVLTEVQRDVLKGQIEVAKGDMSWWRRIQASGVEKVAVFSYKSGQGIMGAGITNDIFMQINDNAMTGGMGLAMAHTGVNAVSNSAYRNLAPQKYRMDQMKLEMMRNLMEIGKSDPAQVQRVMVALKEHTDLGLGDYFVREFNTLVRCISPGNGVRFVGPEEMLAHSYLLSTSDIPSTFGEVNQFDLRQKLTKDAENLGLTSSEEIITYVNDHYEKMVTEYNARKSLGVTSREASKLRGKLNSSAVELDALIANEEASLRILTEAQNNLGISTKTPQGKPISFNASDFASSDSFTQAFIRETGAQPGSVENGKLIGVISDPNFQEKFKDFRVAFEDYQKTKLAKDTLAKEFGEGQAKLEEHTTKINELVNGDALRDVAQWRPGQVFSYFDPRDGTASRGTVIANGMTIIEKEMVDGRYRTEILIDYTKAGKRSGATLLAMQEEFAHRLFTSQTYSNVRITMAEELFGSWRIDADGIHKQIKEGSLVTVDENGKPDMPMLRVLAKSYAENLPEAEKQMFIAKVERGIELYQKNPYGSQYVLMDITNELFSNGWKQRLNQMSPGSGKLRADPSTERWGIEGSTLIPNRGEKEAPSTASRLMKLSYKMTVGELTTVEAFGAAKTILLNGADESQLPPERRLYITRQAAKLATWFGKGEKFDQLLGKSSQELLLAQNISPEIFGSATDNWSSGKIYDQNGNRITLPDGIQTSVDTAIYAARRTLKDTDPATIGVSVYPFNPDGTPIPNVEGGHNAVLWAAQNNKMYMIDPKTNQLRNLKDILKEGETCWNNFSKLVLESNKKGELIGFSISTTDDGVSIGGRVSQKDVAILNRHMEETNVPYEQRAIIAQVAGALADSDPNHPAYPGRENHVPIFIVEYAAVQEGKYGTTNVKKGINVTTRQIAPISLRIEYSTIDEFGNKIIGADGKPMSIPRAVIKGIDVDKQNRRVLLAWTGQITNEDGSIAWSQDQIQSVIDSPKQLRQLCNIYLQNIALGGPIERNLKDTKTPPRTTIEIFQEYLQVNGLSASRENANLIARFVADTVGGNPSEFVKTGKMKDIEDVPTDTQVGQRKLFERRNIKGNPNWGMRDRNFILTDMVVGRIRSFTEPKTAEGKQILFPWGENSNAWNNVRYAPAGWSQLGDAESYRTPGMLGEVRAIVNVNPEEVKNVKLGVSGIWIHPAGYSVVKYKEGGYRVFDSFNRFVTESATIGEAQGMAHRHANNNPSNITLPFDQAMKSELTLVPIGLNLVTAGGMTRRQSLVTPDNRFNVTWSSKGKGTITDMKTGLQVASNIEVFQAENGRYDLSELKAALILANDPHTKDSPVLNLGQYTGPSTGTKTRFGDSPNITNEHLEFFPVSVGRNVKGTKMYSSGNPAYYIAKARLIEMLGPKEALKVIQKMKTDLGENVVGTNPEAVSKWVLNHLSEKATAETEAAVSAEASSRASASADIRRQMEATAAKETAEAQKNYVSGNEKMHNAFVAPMQRVFLKINEKRQEAGLPLETSVNPAQARISLTADMERFASQKKALSTPTPGKDISAYSDLGRSLNQLGTENKNLRLMIAKGNQDLWMSKFGYILTMDLSESPILPFGTEVTANLKGPLNAYLSGVNRVTHAVRSTKALLKGSAKTWTDEHGDPWIDWGTPEYEPLKPVAGQKFNVRFRVYNPSGYFVGSAKSQAEAAQLIMDSEDRYKNKNEPIQADAYQTPSSQK